MSNGICLWYFGNKEGRKWSTLIPLAGGKMQREFCIQIGEQSLKAADEKVTQTNIQTHKKVIQELSARCNQHRACRT